MNCPRCNKLLAKHEHAQPMTVMGRTVYPRSFCDACCRLHTWIPGSREALDKLVYGVGVARPEEAAAA